MQFDIQKKINIGRREGLMGFFNFDNFHALCYSDLRNE